MVTPPKSVSRFPPSCALCFVVSQEKKSNQSSGKQIGDFIICGLLPVSLPALCHLHSLQRKKLGVSCYGLIPGRVEKRVERGRVYLFDCVINSCRCQPMHPSFVFEEQPHVCEAGGYSFGRLSSDNMKKKSPVQD